MTVEKFLPGERVLLSVEAIEFHATVVKVDMLSTYYAYDRITY